MSEPMSKETNPTESKPAALKRTARAAQFAIIALGVYVLVLNVAVFALMRLAFQTVESDAAGSLERLAKRMTEPARDYFWVLTYTWDPVTLAVDDASLQTYRQLGDWQNLIDAVVSTRNEPSLGQMDLLTPGGEWLLTGDGDIAPPGARGRFLAEDRAGILEAAAGRTVVTESSAGHPMTRIYHPVRTREGEVVAVLRLEGKMPEGLMRVRNRLFLGMLVSVGILVFLWLWAVRLVRRTLEAERAAAQSDRLRALGTMTAGIAHEIRNPLGIIHLQVEEFRALARDVPDEAKRVELLSIGDDLLKETRRLKDLTQSFLDFTRASSAVNKDRRLLDVSKATEQTLNLWKKGVSPELRTVEFRSSVAGATVSFSEDRLRQVLLNLLRNADDALGRERGTISVAVDRSGAMLTIAVSDSGPGIPRETLEQIFDPFFTTRAEGTGLGLSVSRALAEAGGGTLKATSEPGRGATFILALPEKVRLEEDRTPPPA